MLYYIDRETGTTCKEKIYGQGPLSFLYGNVYGTCFGLGKLFVSLFSRVKLFSRMYGLLQKAPWSHSKIAPFIQKFSIQLTDFQIPQGGFRSFNDFFVRKLRVGARPIAETPAIMPADGRYLFFPNLRDTDVFYVKGQALNLEKLIGNAALAATYKEGSCVFARLCPSDYHRFHFPCDGTPREHCLINGYLNSVNPMALKKNLTILSQNKRMLTPFDTKAFGRILCIEIGAINVGSIVQTFTPNASYKKGDEKGYFEFGGSSLILLFQPGKIRFSKDLTAPEGIEILCKMGSPLGTEM